MKHIAILFILALVGCIPQAVKDTHKATQIAQEDFANNAELVLEKTIELYAKTASIAIENAYQKDLDRCEKEAGQDVAKFRSFMTVVLESKNRQYANVQTEIGEIRKSFGEAKIDLEGARMLNEALSKYLNAKKVDPAQATELIEMILNKVIKKKGDSK